ncbi:MAG: hypothetical protein ACI9MR_002358 [Myxococcota bacterium]|jgi:hypothetical protein
MNQLHTLPIVFFGAFCLSTLACDDGGQATATDTAADVSDSGVSETDTGTVETAVPDGTVVDDIADTSLEDIGDTTVADTTPMLDPNGDTDKDGIFDLVEVEDGTDPFDPRSARAWHPEIVGHPRLYLGPGDITTVAARIGQEGPHATVWARITGKANQTPPEQPTDGTYAANTAVARGEIAQDAAFVGLLTGDAEMTTKAAAIISAPFPDPRYLATGSSFNVGQHYDLTEAEALVAYCGAYDFLAGTPGVATAVLEGARNQLVARIDAFRDTCLGPGGCRALLKNERNNHTMKGLGALGLCAIAAWDRPEAAEDFNEAVAGLDFLFNRHQAVPEGGYGESWNYLNYGGQSFIQVMLAWHRLAPGAVWPLRGLGTITPTDPEKGSVRMVQDFAENPTTRRVFLAMIQAATPDGLGVAIDDGNPSAAPSGFLAALFDDGRFLWNWNLPRVGHRSSKVAAATFAALDPAMQVVEPDWATDLFLPEAGFSVLRSSFETDQLYIHVNHERGLVRSSGYSHEHADNLSIIVFAFGEPLVIDPGYINYSEHLRIKYGSDHNLVLVDGAGPAFTPIDPIVQAEPNADAYLHTWDDDPAFTTLIASTKYDSSTEVRRRVVRVAQRYAIVADSMPSAQERTYTWQLNGLAGGTVPNTTWTAEAMGGTWARPAASVRANILATSGTTAYGENEEDHQAGFGWKQHIRLTAEASMRQNAGFLALVQPFEAGATAPDVIAIDTPDGVAAFVVRDLTHSEEALVVLNLTETATTIAWAETTTLAAPGLSYHPGDDSGAHQWSMETPEIPAPVPYIPE